MSYALSVISLVIATVALVLTIRRDRRSLLFELHSSFVARDASAGRALLHRRFDTHGPEWFRHASEQDRVVINSALSQLDSLAFQVLRGYVSRRDGLMLWGPAAQVCWTRADAYVAQRRSGEGAPVWSWFEALVELADSRPKDLVARPPRWRAWNGA